LHRGHGGFRHSKQAEDLRSHGTVIAAVSLSITTNIEMVGSDFICQLCAVQFDLQRVQTRRESRHSAVRFVDGRGDIIYMYTNAISPENAYLPTHANLDHVQAMYGYNGYWISSAEMEVSYQILISSLRSSRGPKHHLTPLSGNNQSTVHSPKAIICNFSIGRTGL
jgi:hypothetical protein